ncbi:hypothetical protein AMTRI_Chr03g47400 [Amborella trichopoda]
MRYYAIAFLIVFSLFKVMVIHGAETSEARDSKESLFSTWRTHDKSFRYRRFGHGSHRVKPVFEEKRQTPTGSNPLHNR